MSRSGRPTMGRPQTTTPIEQPGRSTMNRSWNTRLALHECAPVTGSAIPIMFRTTAMGFAKRSTDPIGCPSGKSGPSSDFGFSFVQPLLKKYFCFTESKSVLYSRLSHPTEGRCATSSTRGGMRWTRKVLLTRAFDADGEGVWSWHPDAGVKFAKGNFCGRRWPKSPCTGESAQ